MALATSPATHAAAIKLALIGYGKMGKAIEAIAVEQRHEVVLTIDHDNLFDLTAEKLRQADVAIEFTGPDSAYNNVMACLRAGIPVVCGSTGWLDKLEEVKQYCSAHNGCFVYASNFSIGVNIFFEVNRRLAALMNPHPEYEVVIEEIHHTQKKDAPSGTAVSLAEQVLESVDRKQKWVNAAAANLEELPIVSKRIDPYAGRHSVRYQSAIDDIEIIHTAHSRAGFAAGAVAAAVFAKGKNGIFSMKEVLGL